MMHFFFVFFFQAEDGIRDYKVTGVQDVCSSDLSIPTCSTCSSGARYTSGTPNNSSIRTRSTASTRQRFPAIAPEAAVAPGCPGVASGLGGRAPGNIDDQTFRGQVDEFLIVAQFLEFPAELVAQLGLFIPAQLVLPVEFGGAGKGFFEYAGQALLRHDLGRIVGDRGRIALGHVLRQALGKFINLADGKEI